MSSLWTPGGERPVPPSGPASPTPAEEPAFDDFGLEDAAPMDPEMEARLDELRQQLADAPVEGIVAQMAYQLFEVGALHLSLQPPQLVKAQLAIDALGALVEGLGERLGEHVDPLREGLSQIRMAFVQIKNASAAPPPSGPDDPAPPQS
jgi:hypothetical protein